MLCTTCPVRLPCLEHGLGQRKDDGGIWGGTSARQRRHARQRGLDAAELLAELDL
jgi:hypothetical protein